MDDGGSGGIHCRHGHLLDDANTYWRLGKRVCRECGRVASREYMRRRRQQRRNGTLQESPRGYRTDSEAYLAVALGRFRGSYKADPDTGCWVWQLGTNGKGYGLFSFMGRTVLAHRAAYYLLVGEVQDGLELDHLCRRRGCVNPAHLEQVTGRENVLRGEGPTAKNAGKTRCPQGHVYTPDNLVAGDLKRGYRSCRQCHNARRPAAQK